jgi:tetratricopeptide (TPR) repeat protein
VTGMQALALAIHRPPTLPGEGSVTADTALDRAIALGPDLPETVRARGWYEFNVMRDRETALGHFEAARLMRPGDPDLTGAIGLIRISQGAWDEGLAYLEGAMRLDPRSYWRAGLLGQMYAHARRYEDAERWYDRALLVAPSYAEGYIGKAIVHLKRDGDIGRALEVLEQASKNVDRGEFIFSFTQVMSRHPFIRILDNYFQAGLGDSSIALYLRQRCTGCYLQLEAELAESRDDVQVARVYYDSAYGMYGGQSRRRPSRLLTLSAAALGRYGEATRYAEELLEFAPLSSEAVSGYHVLETVAETRVRIGDSDGAIAALEQLLSHPGLLSVPVLELDPLWDPLREHPEFQRLLRQYR